MRGLIWTGSTDRENPPRAAGSETGQGLSAFVTQSHVTRNCLTPSCVIPEFAPMPSPNAPTNPDRDGDLALDDAFTRWTS